jgi:hypothetical protein
MDAIHRFALVTALLSALALLCGCNTKYVDADTSGTNKAGARTVQLDVLATLSGCTVTLPANAPFSVSCSYQGPGSLVATSTFQLRDLPPGTQVGSATGAVLLQVPASATGFNGTYSGPVSGALKFTTVTAPLAADGAASIVAEAGNKLLLIENPPALGEFRFIINFTESGAAPSPMPVKALLVGKVTANGRDYYPPVLPCTSSFAAIPALLLPTLNFYAPIDMSPLAAQKGCANVAYSFAPGVEVVEFYNMALDHYFITWMAAEIAALDAGTVIKGWARTGHKFRTFTTAQAGTVPVCRFYIPPGLGDSHFFGRGPVECADTHTRFPALVEEDPAFMHMTLPAAGVCPPGTIPVYRVFSNRADANHRYMTDKAVRDLMVAAGWTAEGDGPDLVVMCAPA